MYRVNKPIKKQSRVVVLGTGRRERCMGFLCVVVKELGVSLCGGQNVLELGSGVCITM